MVYNRYSKEKKEVLRALYSDASKEEIMSAIPNRSWKSICERAHALGLHRSYAVKGRAISEAKTKKKPKL
jgi:hypothetical protein